MFLKTVYDLAPYFSHNSCYFQSTWPTIGNSIGHVEVTVFKHPSSFVEMNAVVSNHTRTNTDEDLWSHTCR